MTDTPEFIVAEYREAYRRAQALQAYWIWHALTNGQAPNMVPRDLMRPSGRCTWCRDDDGHGADELPTDEQIAEWERLAPKREPRTIEYPKIVLLDWGSKDLPA